jgi:hypothetical protein
VAALAAIGRPPRELVVLEPTRTVGPPTCFFIVVGDRYQTESPALALGFGLGQHILGRSHPDSPYPKQVTGALLFEGSQCILSISDRVVITSDVSTNGTFVVPPDEARRHERIRHPSPLLRCPHAMSPHDLLWTVYAELILVSA